MRLRPIPGAWAATSAADETTKLRTHPDCQAREDLKFRGPAGSNHEGNSMIKKLAVVIVLGSACFGYCRQQYAQAQASPQATAKSKSGIDQDIQLLRKDIRSQKKQLIAANLSLTAEQATKFWPLYDQYTAELSKIGDQKTALIKEYADQWGTMTDEQASSLVTRSLAVDEQTAQLRIKYMPIFSQAVPGQVVATFFQLDRRFQALLDIQLASQIPLVQDQN